MPFSPQSLLLLFDQSLLEEFLASYSIEAPSSSPEALYQSLMENPRFADIEADLRDIACMSREASIQRIVDFAEDTGVELPPEFYSSQNDESKSLWIFQNQKDLFDNVFLWDTLQDYGNQYNLRFEGELNNTFFTEDMTVRLESILQKEFKAESKAQNCKVLKHYNKKTNALCFSVYFDDFSKAELHFGTRGKLLRVARRPVRGIHFILFLDEKKIALQFSRARNKRKVRLLSLFLEAVFGFTFSDEDSRTLVLTPLASRTFTFTIPPEEKDDIELIRVKVLRLDKAIYSRGQRITLDVKDGDNDQDIFDLIDSSRINLDLYDVTQAVIQFKFKNMGKRGSVTTTLTLPNSDNLLDSTLHKRCRKYLQQSGIIR